MPPHPQEHRQSLQQPRRQPRRAALKRRPPINFEPALIEGILNGQITRARRYVRLQFGYVMLGGKHWHPSHPDAVQGCPFGNPGDRIWLREAWVVDRQYDDMRPQDLPEGIPIHYLSDGAAGCPQHAPGTAPFEPGRRRNSGHMPAWASRAHLLLQDVRLQHLHQIQPQECLQEGFTPATVQRLHLPALPCDALARNHQHFADADKTIEAYSNIWEYLYGRNSWNNNPLVWNIHFRTELTPQGRLMQQHMQQREQRASRQDCVQSTQTSTRTHIRIAA